MPKVSADEIRRLASLSKIQLSDDEVEQYRKEFEKILGYVSQLQSADTEGVEPTSQVTGLVNVTRPDEIKDYGVTKQQLLDLAPDQEDGYIKVRRVL
ncbi:MAG: Asp-tRNA(Asn)/Glu-tRNA(Gln) amidotransferase subunit GatC [Candidatus Saccharimonadales bacterium]|nr:Asp-tRNA(Asn)/Glu-tRNA(Gln) amidotransferase subunit GatC [Candidatus Saccharimonadales bacterium]